MALSAFFFAVMAAGAKLLGGRIPPQEVILVRGVLNVAFMLWLLRRRGLSWRPKRAGVLLLRGALGHFALSCYFWSVARQPLATAVLLQQVHPVFTAVLAAWFLKEKPGKRFLPAFLLAASGVALLVPRGTLAAGGAPAPLAPILVGLVGALLSAAAYVTVRDASRTEHEETIVLWFPLTSVPLAAIGTFVEGPAVPTPFEWGWLVFIAAAGQLGQLFLTRGLARVPAGRATLANPLTIVFGAALGWVAFGEPVGFSMLAGGAAIVAAVLLAGAGRRAGAGHAPEPLAPGGPGLDSRG
jgi:drug/metabolite transporter (DMT)-like permease